MTEHQNCVARPAVQMPPMLLSDSPMIDPADRVCPEGTVPQPGPEYTPKGFPGSDPTEADSPVRYFYAGAYQFVTARGVFGWISQHAPTVGYYDYHSLAEIAARSSDGRQTVEVGWTVDPQTYGDDFPHLFVYHWVDGQPTCYNGCGWVQVSGYRYPGMVLPETYPDSPQPFAISRHDGKWWIGYQMEWIGYFPDSLWDGTFKELGLLQWFGEVAAKRYLTLTDMGNGESVDSDSAALMDDLQYTDHEGKFRNATPTAIVTLDCFYDVGEITSNGFHFGGTGLR